MSSLANKIKTKYPQYANIPDSELESKVVAKYPQYKSLSSSQDKKSSGLLGYIGDTIKNVPGSAVKTVKDTISPLLTPVQTVKNLGNLALGTAQLAIPGEQGQEKTAMDVGRYYVQKYGGPKRLANTFREDPVGVVADVAGLLSGGGAALKATGNLAKASKVANIGGKVSRLGNTIDPLMVAGRASRPAFRGVGRATGAVSDVIGRKAQKFNKTDIEAITKATGTDPLTYARQEGLPIAATNKSVGQLQDIISSVKDKYNSMVRTGKQVNRQDYARDIKAQADALLQRSDTPSTRALAQQLYEEAKYQMKNTAPMTDDLLAGTKSEAFSNASKSQINDPLISGREEKLGRASVETLEQYAPGSKELGKKQRGLIEYRDKLRSQANTGQGTQLLNLFKPAGAGLLAGAGAGSFIPGLGNIAGGILGATAATIANSPQFLAAASNALNRASQLQLPPSAIRALEKAVDAGRTGRMLNLSDQESREIEQALQLQQLQVQNQSSSDYTLNGQSGGLFNHNARSGSAQQPLFNRNQ
jgi:hypothetical protein